MPQTPIANFEDLLEGQPYPVRVAEREFVLCLVENQVYAVDGLCPHVGGPLGHGAMNGRMLVCPWHAWEFDCTTGRHDRNPACRLQTYPVTIEHGQILLDLPDA